MTVQNVSGAALYFTIMLSTITWKSGLTVRDIGMDDWFAIVFGVPFLQLSGNFFSAYTKNPIKRNGLKRRKQWK